MGRRRLTPLPADQNVPRAEHFFAEPPIASGLGPLDAPRSPAAPIARVAAEAAGAAALDELAETLRRAREDGRLALELPLDAIAADHLTRDRLPVEDGDMASLRESLRAHGQRMPIEVTPLTGVLPYGLISGWRRLMALKALHAQTNEPRFATVKALVRRPEAAADAYAAMVEENEIRVGLSQYERARVAVLATKRGVFPTEKAALLALFPTASRPKRSRIRAFLEIVHALDGVLRFPAQLPERLGLRLVEGLRAGQGPRVAAALAAADPATSEAEFAAVAAALAPGIRPAVREASEALAPGVEIAISLRGQRLTLTLTGPGVNPALAAEARALLQRLRAN